MNFRCYSEKVTCCHTGLLIVHYGFLILWVFLFVCVSGCFLVLFACLLSKERETERKGVELGEWEGRDDLIGIGRREVIIIIYFMNNIIN